MLPNTNANRREMMRTLLAAGVGAAGTAAFAGEPGKLTNTEFKTLAASPKTMADHRTLAKYYRAMVAEHEAEAKAFETFAAQYAKGLPGVTAGHAHELSRAAKHDAEHSRDFG